MPWTPYAKRQNALSMYRKGKNFLAAAVLLQGKGGYEYVVLHLFCQGVEVVLKALLLLKDFDRYGPKLRRKYGHNLVPLTKDVLSTFGLNPARTPLVSELLRLNSFYSKQLLRYGSFLDLLVDPSTINWHLAARRMTAALRLIERELARTPGS